MAVGILPNSELSFQHEMLQQVSSTYARTIPLLPPDLYPVVCNLYLHCRIADTIEDEPALDLNQKRELLDRYVRVLAGDADARNFSHDMHASLTDASRDCERTLAGNTFRIVGITNEFNDIQRTAITRCLRIMSGGMVEFLHVASPRGLDDMPHLDRYCYHVAGVVAETLAELFCDHSPEIEEHRADLFKRCISYGQALQMTNILKDVWDDSRNGVCWLPREVFKRAGFDLDLLAEAGGHSGFAAGIRHLSAIAVYHVAESIKFILTIPGSQAGIRRHLLCTLGMAVQALRQINGNSHYLDGNDIDLRRWKIAAIAQATGTLARSDQALKLLFGTMMRPLPEQCGP